MIKNYLTTHPNGMISDIGSHSFGDISFMSENSQDVIELSHLEILMITDLRRKTKEVLYFDKQTRNITNENGDVLMFSPGNGTSGTMLASTKNLKHFVEKVTPEEAKQFNETLEEFRSKVQHLEDLKVIQQTVLEEAHRDMFESIGKHEKVVCSLHDKLCRALAICEYNEFKHKIHVESDGSVFIIDKDVSV